MTLSTIPLSPILPAWEGPVSFQYWKDTLPFSRRLLNGLRVQGK